MRNKSRSDPEIGVADVADAASSAYVISFFTVFHIFQLFLTDGNHSEFIWLLIKSVARFNISTILPPARGICDVYSSISGNYRYEIDQIRLNAKLSQFIWLQFPRLSYQSTIFNGKSFSVVWNVEPIQCVDSSIASNDRLQIHEMRFITKVDSTASILAQFLTFPTWNQCTTIEWVIRNNRTNSTRCSHFPSHCHSFQPESNEWPNPITQKKTNKKKTDQSTVGRLSICFQVFVTRTSSTCWLPIASNSVLINCINIWVPAINSPWRKRLSWRPLPIKNNQFYFNFKVAQLAGNAHKKLNWKLVIYLFFSLSFFKSTVIMIEWVRNESPTN